MLASTSVDREIRFWRVEIEPEENVWARRGTPIGFSADRRTLITLATNQTGNLMSLAFSPDGNSLVVASRVPVPRPFVQILQPGSLAEIDATIRER